jgi:hypothetical protein
MAIRLTPHVLSVIDWTNALDDPVRRQFIPMKSSAMPDHPKLTMDSLNEEHDSPVKGLVHRYQDKALFLGKSNFPDTSLTGSLIGVHSDFDVSFILPILYPVLCCRIGYKHSHQEELKAKQESLGRYVQVYREHTNIE